MCCPTPIPPVLQGGISLRNKREVTAGKKIIAIKINILLLFWYKKLILV